MKQRRLSTYFAMTILFLAFVISCTSLPIQVSPTPTATEDVPSTLQPAAEGVWEGSSAVFELTANNIVHFKLSIKKNGKTCVIEEEVIPVVGNGFKLDTFSYTISGSFDGQSMTGSYKIRNCGKDFPGAEAAWQAQWKKSGPVWTPTPWWDYRLLREFCITPGKSVSQAPAFIKGEDSHPFVTFSKKPGEDWVNSGPEQNLQLAASDQNLQIVVCTSLLYSELVKRCEYDGGRITEAYDGEWQIQFFEVKTGRKLYETARVAQGRRVCSPAFLYNPSTPNPFIQIAEITKEELNGMIKGLVGTP